MRSSQSILLLTLVFILHSNVSSAMSTITAMSKDQIACTMCSTCDNPCQPISSPPPPEPQPQPPPPSPPLPPSIPNCTPPPSPPLPPSIPNCTPPPSPPLPPSIPNCTPPPSPPLPPSIPNCPPPPSQPVTPIPALPYYSPPPPSPPGGGDGGGGGGEYYPPPNYYPMPKPPNTMPPNCPDYYCLPSSSVTIYNSVQLANNPIVSSLLISFALLFFF